MLLVIFAELIQVKLVECEESIEADFSIRVPLWENGPSSSPYTIRKVKGEGLMSLFQCHTF